jgi:hypothetical protein
VHVVESPLIRLPGAQESDDALGLTGDTVTVAVALVPRLAVKVTVSTAATVPAVAVNVAELVDPGTVTDGVTPSAPGLLDDSATALPPAGAAWFNVTVQLVAAPEVTPVGLHTSAATARTGVTVTVAVALPPSVAVTVAVCAAVTEAPVATNAAEVALAGTVTDVGTGSALGLLEASATSPPPAGAA